MISLGITGGIGMGKSTAANYLARRGVPIVDTDVLARELVQPGQPSLDEIRLAFGEAVIAADGTLDRSALGRLVFADAAPRRRLEAILHPRIRSAWHAQLAQWRALHQPLVGVVIPLLFETGAESELDLTLCVACSVPTQHLRLSSRGWSQHEIVARCAAQMPVEQKLACSRHVVWSEGSVAALEAQLDRLVRRWTPSVT